MTGRRGFTLIEVVIVVAIIAISLGLVGPRIGAGFGRLELNQSEQTVKTYLKLARNQAQRADREHYLVLDNARRSIQLVGPDMALIREQRLPSSVSFLFDSSRVNVALYVAPSGIISGNSVRLRGRTGEVEISLQ